MTTTRESFVVGDRVTWSDLGSDYWKQKHLEQYGEGPFLVAEVIEVPAKKCNCVEINRRLYPKLIAWVLSFFPKKEEADHHPHCHEVLINPDTVGHHQWLQIPELGWQPPNQGWSGVWFRKYQPASSL